VFEIKLLALENKLKIFFLRYRVPAVKSNVKYIISIFVKSESYVAFSLGNPVELSKPVLVSNTQQFKVYAIKSDSVIEPTFHPCLQARVQYR
jgi:hypothetical protein